MEALMATEQTFSPRFSTQTRFDANRLKAMLFSCNFFSSFIWYAWHACLCFRWYGAFNNL